MKPHQLTLLSVFLLLSGSLLSKDTQISSWQAVKENIRRDIQNPDDDFEATSVIRSHIAQLIDLPGSNKSDIDILYPDNHSFSLNRFVDIFQKDSAGAICGTTAFILKKAYEDFGYHCSTLSIGDRTGKLAHVTCLVDINYNGGKISVIQDATFNFSIVRKDNSPVDYTEMVSLLNSGKPEMLQIKEEEKYCDYLTDRKLKLNEKRDGDCGEKIVIVKSVSRKLKERVPKNLSFLWMGCGTMGIQCLDMIEERGYTRNMLNFFLIDPLVIN